MPVLIDDEDEPGDPPELTEEAIIRIGPEGMILELPSYLMLPENGDRDVPEYVLAATEVFQRATSQGIRALADAFEERVKRQRNAN